jgi:hypothetical protein
MGIRDDDHLPEDLREIADGIRESRYEPSPLELDELKQRARRQAERGPRPIASWRRKLVAAILALGLMFSSGAGVVVAAQSLGKKPGKQKLKLKGSVKGMKAKLGKSKKDASKSQYCPPTKHDDSDSDSARDRDSDSDCDNTDSDKDTDSDSDSD